MAALWMAPAPWTLPVHVVFTLLRRGVLWRVRRQVERSAWREFIPFLYYDVEISGIACTTSAIPFLNAPLP